MSGINTLGKGTVESIWQSMEDGVLGANSIEEASTHLLRHIHDELKDSLALARVFVTVPLARIPAPRQEFARRIASEINDETFVFCLLATQGVEPAWNDVAASQGHLAIPLASAEFVSAVPMLSRLIQDFEVGNLIQGGLVTGGEELSVRFFFVPDATSSLDEKGRKIIPSQDFVRKYGVKSVFGIGGPYRHSQQFVLAAIFFAKTRLDREIFRLLKPIFERFMIATQIHIMKKNVFNPSKST